jgi:hypothetical protein
MRIPTAVALTMIVLAAVIGCGESNDSPVEDAFPDGAALLGLTRNHDLRYIVYDSIVTVSPESLIVTRDTSYLDISIIRGQQNQVELDVSGLAHDLLTVDASGVLHSGQIRSQAMPPDTLYYYPTPVIMPRVLGSGSAWSFTSPMYREGSLEKRKTLLNLIYGYYVERKFVGMADVVLPSRSFSTYRFRAALFFDESSFDTLMTIDEYYANGIGPVKIVSRFERSQRLILLLTDH